MFSGSVTDTFGSINDTNDTSRSINDVSRSTNDTTSIVRMTIVSDAPSCGIILMTVKVSFTIIIFL
jgi:hypothetical protein